VFWRAKGEYIGDCGLATQQVDGVPEACFSKPEPIGRRMGAEEFRDPFFCPPFFCLLIPAIFTKRAT
jgi:hypothetical protein